jgi:hypothetical protein
VVAPGLASQGSRVRALAPIYLCLGAATADVPEGLCGCGWGRHSHFPAECWSVALGTVAVAAAGVAEAEEAGAEEAAAGAEEAVAGAEEAVAGVEVVEAGTKAVEASAAELRRTSTT